MDVNRLNNLLLLLFLLVVTSCDQEADGVDKDCSGSGLTLTLLGSTDTSCGASAGGFEVEASGGFGGYRYQIDDGAFQNSGVFSSVAPGKYIVGVEDSEGCSSSLDVQIYSGISFSVSIKPIIETNCAISGCHDGTGNIDYNNFDNIKLNPSDIKSRTQSGDMPRNGTLTAAEIDMIACWVDDGALNN
ncbi:MAG: hypothetical protein RIE86_16670 [Imperialibacter sp.]|uniref:hypothetical protein n=1 Tax=Imperialibacter sp. TaxID=2038411 RepID=UPI0032F00443